LSRCTFEVHWEDFYNAIYPREIWNQISRNSELLENTLYLLRILEENKIKATFYILGHTRDANRGIYKAIVKSGHEMGSHGYWHEHNEKGTGLFRSPYWDTTPLPGLCGGFFFRSLPLWLVKHEVKRTGVFFLHPHDIMVNHPPIKNIFLNWKRHVGLKNARQKLERLIKDVNWRTH